MVSDGDSRSDFLGTKKIMGLYLTNIQHMKSIPKNNMFLCFLQDIYLLFLYSVLYIYIYVTQKQQRMLREPQKYVAGLPVIDDFFV